MSIQFLLTDEEVRQRQEHFSLLFNDVSITEIERRRAGLVVIKRRFLKELSMGAYQYVSMAIKFLEEKIIEHAMEGSSLSESEACVLEDQVKTDREFEAKLAMEHLQADSLEFQQIMAGVYGLEPPARSITTD